MRSRLATPLVLTVFLACELPTELPRWEQTWVLPVERLEVSVAALLPDSVALSPDSSTFVTPVPGASVSLSLGEMCGSACLLVAGMRAPKPAFHDTLTTGTTLPADLISAILAGGAFDATLAHSLSFDPLRPSADTSAERGHLVVRITSNGNLVAYDSIDGATRAFPDSVRLTPTLAVRAVEITDSVEIEIAVYSPAGDSTTIDPTDTLGVSFARSAVEISEVTIAASGLPVDSVATSMSFGQVDSATVSRIESGALRFGVQNPFAVTGTLDFTFQGDFGTSGHQLAIREGTYEDRVDFTADEVRDIVLADSVEVVTSGSVSSNDGTLTVAPSDVLILDSELELVVVLGPLDSP